MIVFKTKARAVEMLGRQQIADLSTAILELWKNGYDAYADSLTASLYLPGHLDVKQPFAVVTDDGKGMSREDLEEKWVVLGTDSKSRNELDKKDEETLWKEPRIKMGEKGIGRLSVAYLGSPMLMFTKKHNEPLQVVFFHWEILENYKLFLDDVVVPMKSVPDSSDFENVFSALKKELLENLIEKGSDGLMKPIEQWSGQMKEFEKIKSEIEKTAFPSFFEDEFIAPYFQKLPENKGYGTKFIIFNPNEQFFLLKDAMKTDTQLDEKNKEAAVIKEVQTSLNGFANIFKGRGKIDTSFLIHGEREFDIVSKSEFFVEKDFEGCDHCIAGKFDTSGRFEGSIRIYKETIEKYSFTSPTRSPGITPYGPFEIKVGYMMGKEEETSLPDETYRTLEKKLNRFGGLYLYRDGFRVLPYGRIEHDFLGFEERRSRNAGRYFFSHRRMFGYIEITRANNPNLKDKASREGLVSNQASREFKADLEAFFINLALQFFGRDAKSDVKQSQLDKMKKAADAERKEKEFEIEERRKYAQQLRALPDSLKRLKVRLVNLNGELQSILSKSEVVYGEMEALLDEINRCKSELTGLRPFEPVRVKPTEAQRKLLFEYERQFEEFSKTTLSAADETVAQARARLEEAALMREFNNRYKLFRSLLHDLFSEADNKLQKTLKKLQNSLDMEGEIVLQEFEEKYQALAPPNTSKETVLLRLQLLDNAFQQLQEKTKNRVDAFIGHLDRLRMEIDEDALTGYYKLKFEELSERLDLWQELGQLGMAVEIIDHQFNVLYSQLAKSIEAMKGFISGNPKAQREYELMKAAFEHLEDNYKLLTPLYRTSGKIRKDVTGKEVADYIRRFFQETFREERIRLEVTPAFEKFSLYTYESVLIPVFINIVNNAVYWLIPARERQILFDVKDGKIVVCNSGVPVEGYLLEDIFKPFYTKKPKGRGIGLYVSRTSLRENGLDLIATNDPGFNVLNGACFIIQPYSKQNSDEQ